MSEHLPLVRLHFAANTSTPREQKRGKLDECIGFVSVYSLCGGDTPLYICVLASSQQPMYPIVHCLPGCLGVEDNACLLFDGEHMHIHTGLVYKKRRSSSSS